MNIEVLLPIALPQTFTYRLPAGTSQPPEPGQRVKVEFGQRKISMGLVWEGNTKVDNQEELAVGKIKEIIEVIDPEPILDVNQIHFWKWMADYYLCSLGEVMKAALPGGLKSEGYRPLTEHLIRIHPNLDTDEKMNRALDQLGKAPNQFRIMVRAIELSGWSGKSKPLDMLRSEIMTGSDQYTALKALIKKEFLQEEEKETSRLSVWSEPRTPLQPLNPAQEEVFRRFHKQSLQVPVQLLHGITSSGKTEVYMHLIKGMLEEHKQVLYLLPEIAITTQIISRLKLVFGDSVVVYHSRFSDQERTEIWNKIQNKTSEKGLLILGVRSSVFLPFRDLGLIIVDEEHENSYKQFDPAPRYHARDCAIVLGQIHHVQVLLGTATPSMESYYHASTGKYGLLQLAERYGGIEPPKVFIADTREAKRKKRMHGHFTPLLLEAIDDALTHHEQVILFQNRRGYSPYLECGNCGRIPKCTSCDVSLTHHQSRQRLLCHYCGFSTPVPSKCPACESTGLLSRGVGTEKLEDEIRMIFPQARVDRMDMDSTRSKRSYFNILSDFESGKKDILIGTQMISKGLDFSNVALVGIVDADQLLNYPDFRSSERSFQLMTQVSGRAGRRQRQGNVVIQTADPGHPIITQVLQHNYISFFEMELSDRKAFRYPPFTRLVRITLKHANLELVAKASHFLARDLSGFLPDKTFGPQSPLVGRIQGKHLKTILLKLDRNPSLQPVKKHIHSLIHTYNHHTEFRRVLIQVDVDPA